MHKIAGLLQEAVEGLGGFAGGLGIFFVAFCDSSFLSLPEINDVLILYFCTREKERAYYYVLMATLGSTSGCLALYGFGRFKGYSFLKRRYSDGRLQSALRLFQRYGMFAIIGPALMPPPFPFKIFVLSSGVFGLSLARFLTAVLVGRGLRYSIEGTMAVYYGDRAWEYFQANYLRLALLLLGALALVLIVLVVSRALRRRATAGARPADTSTVRGGETPSS
jgi:membrane protein YqaA with SNARE-associated domain